MRIAVIDNLPEGGAKRVVWEHIQYLAKKNEILYCTNHVSSSFEKKIADISISKKNFCPPAFRGLLRPLQEMKLSSYLQDWYGVHLEKIQEWKANVILAHPCQATQSPTILFLQKKNSQCLLS